MTAQFVVELGRDTMMTAMWVVGPVMMVGFVVGMVVSLLQAITQLNEVTIGFVPKLFAIGVTLVVCGNWMLQHLMTYTTHLLGNFGQLIR